MNFFAFVGVMCVRFCGTASPTTALNYKLLSGFVLLIHIHLLKGCPDRSEKPGEGFVSWRCAGLAADSRN